jgi:hypothetical protein
MLECNVVDEFLGISGAVTGSFGWGAELDSFGWGTGLSIVA